MSFSVNEAAVILGLSTVALRARINRTEETWGKDATAGRRRDLDAGVYVLMGPFEKRWRVHIPEALLVREKKTKRAR